MSLAEVNNNYSSFSPTTQQNNFRHYVAPADSDIEQDYTGTSSYSNDESNLEDNIGEALEGVTDSEEENDPYTNAATSFTTEDEEDDDDEMECSSDSDSDITEDDQNNSTIQNHLFESESTFNVHRNGGGIINGNIINVSNQNNTNSSSNNNNILPPIQLLPVNPPPSMSTSTLNTSTTQPPNRSISSDLLPFGERLPTLNSMNTRDMPHRNPPPYNHGGGAYGVIPYNEGFSISQQQTVFRLPNGSHPPPTYSSSTDSISQPSIPPPSSTTIPVTSQQKQGPLRFGFPDAHESRGHEVDGEDEDDGSSSTNSYDTTSSRKRARSTSNDWANMHPHQIQFGSLEPVNRGVISRQNVNHNSRVSSTHSPILPVHNRSSIGNGIQIDYSQDTTDVHSTPLPPSANFYYSPSSNYTPYSHSSSTTASPSPPIQVRQQPQFFHLRALQTNGLPRRNYQNSSHSLDSSSSTRRSSPDEHDNSYNANFASSGPDLSSVTYPEVQERRNQHTHNNNNPNNANVSQGPRMNLTRWGLNDAQRGGHTESLRPFTFDPGYRRQVPVRTNIFPNSNNSFFGGSLEPMRVHRNGEESDANVEIPGSSNGDASIGNTTTIPPNLTNQWPRSVRRSNTTNRTRTVVPVSTSTSTSTATHTSRNNSTDNNLSDEQLARRIQAREFSATHIQNEDHNVRLLTGTSRARSASRRDTGANTSTSRNGSIRRDASTRVPMTPRIPRLPEILPHHDRHHSEERGNETRGRAHGSRSGQRSGRQNGHSLQRRLIQDYPLLGSFINSSEIEIEEFWDLLPDILGSGIAANPDNYLDEDEFDSSYEGLIRLSERIGDAKPKGVPEHIINNLPTNLYSLGRGKSQEERCTICLTEYENNERLRGLPCSHDFHQECIDSWFKNSDKCPICRRSVTEE